jgi:hypothetical protein
MSERGEQGCEGTLSALKTKMSIRTKTTEIYKENTIKTFRGKT